MFIKGEIYKWFKLSLFIFKLNWEEKEVCFMFIGILQRVNNDVEVVVGISV